MLQDSLETKAVMEALIATEIRRLIAKADVCVFALYDPAGPADGPLDYRCDQRCPRRGTLDVAVDFDFEGIGVWYICTRRGDTFRLRHILVEIDGDRKRTRLTSS